LPPETLISDRKTETKDRQKYEIWSTKAIGELVAKAPDLELPLTKDCVAKALSVYVEQLTEGNIAIFARQLGIPRNTLWLWCKGKNLPSIDALVKICYCLRVSLLDFLTQRIDSADDFQAITLIPNQLQSKPRASSKVFDSNLVRQHLEAVLISNKYPPLSMEEVARGLKCHRRTIYKYFPDLCRAISANYRSYRKANLAKNIEQSGEEATKIALDLHKKGIYPSESRVLELMTMPGNLRYKKVRAVLQEVQRELGELS
jgi:transcriptional regulator with XRE-family HTH domain